MDPAGSVFRNPTFLSYLDAATDQVGPVAHALRQSNVRRAINKLAAGQNLPPQTLNTLWSIVFTDRWYRSAIVG